MGSTCPQRQANVVDFTLNGFISVAAHYMILLRLTGVNSKRSSNYNFFFFFFFFLQVQGLIYTQGKVNKQSLYLPSVLLCSYSAVLFFMHA